MVVLTRFCRPIALSHQAIPSVLLAKIASCKPDWLMAAHPFAVGRRNAERGSGTIDDRRDLFRGKAMYKAGTVSRIGLVDGTWAPD